MEKTLQTQYNLIKEGKGDKAYFLKSAYRLFPDMLSQVNTFSDTVTILKNRGIISEGIGGLVTTGKKQDWHAIFNENMDNLKENSEEEKINKLKDIMAKAEKGDTQATQTLAMLMADIPGLKEGEDEDEELARRGDEEMQRKEDSKALPNIGKLREGKEAKAIEKETTKEVTDMATRGYDYKDEKNYDNVFGQEFLQGYYTEMKDPKNADKHVDELRAIVAKNLAEDINHYVKDGQFGTKGVGYTTEAPGLGEPKEPKGKFKSSGYGDLKESVLRSQIHLLIKEVLAEAFKPEEYVSYDGQPMRVKAYYKLNNVYDLEDTDGKKLKNVPADKVTSSKPTNEVQKDPKAYADEEEFGSKLIDKLKNDLRIKNKHNMTTSGEPDMDLVRHYSDAIKFANQNIEDITNTYFNHSKPEGGVIDAVTYVLSRIKAEDDSNPIHEAKKKPSAGLTKKEKSAISKKAHAGKDIGKKGKGFEKVAKAAEKQYGSEEAGKKVAAAAMWKNLAKGKK